MTYTLHPATENDIPAIQKIARQFKNELGFVMRVSLERAITKSELTIARSDDGAVIGFINWHRRLDNITTVYEIAVSKDSQYQGIGKALIASVPTPVRLKVTQDNPANGFYQHIGMKLIATEQGRKRPLNVYMLGTDEEIHAITSPFCKQEKLRKKWREAKRRQIEAMTDEQYETLKKRQAESALKRKDEIRNYNRQYNRWRYMHMTPEEREKYREYKRAKARERYWAMSEDERRAYLDAHNARERNRRANMTEREREALNERQRRAYRRWVGKMPASERKAYFRQRQGKKDPATVAAYNKRYHAQKKRLRLIQILGA